MIDRVRRCLMGQLVDGNWRTGQSFANPSGEFVRETSRFRN